MGGLKIADDDRKEVIEIMRDAAGEMADRFELLRLSHRLFGGRSTVYLLVEPLGSPTHAFAKHKGSIKKREQSDRFLGYTSDVRADKPVAS